MKLVGFSYITPRKHHYKQDKNKVNKFKKNLQHELKKEEELWDCPKSNFSLNVS